MVNVSAMGQEPKIVHVKHTWVIPFIYFSSSVETLKPSVFTHVWLLSCNSKRENTAQADEVDNSGDGFIFVKNLPCCCCGLDKL